MIAAPFLLALAGAAGPGNLCALCHPDVRVQFERSIHRREEIACVSCHGGDPSAATVEAAHRGGFRGTIRRRDVPALCASCHADLERMRPYDLPTDQLALYQTSQHGRKLAGGDDEAAVCTDCHGIHDIRRHDDPQSSVYPSNVPGTCARCHSDAALMRRHGLSGDPYADFSAGVHGEALLERADASAPSCARCHGAHGAAPPGVGDVDKVCGHCHAATRTEFLATPHSAAMAAAGLPECASCHGNHRIAKTDPAMLDTVCAQCHPSGSPPAQLAARMKALYASASEEIDSARAAVEIAEKVPIHAEDYRARLEEARTSLVESLTAMHSLDLARVELMTERARSVGAEAQSEINGKIEGRKWRRAGLMLFWFYILLTVAILARLRRRAAREALP